MSAPVRRLLDPFDALADADKRPTTLVAETVVTMVNWLAAAHVAAWAATPVIGGPNPRAANR